MKVHEKETIYENRKWRVNALLHVNGAYSGSCINKISKETYNWYKLNNRLISVSDSVPKYISESILEATKQSVEM